MLAREWYRERRGELDGVGAVYWNSFLRSIGGGMLGIFVPVYVFLLTKSVFGSWQAGVAWMLGYVVCQRVVVAVLSLKVGKLIEKLGFRRSVLLATVLDIGLYGLLVAAGQLWWLVLVAGALSGVSVLFYWLPRMAMMAGDGNKRAFGHQVSLLMLIERGAEILGPFVGGVVITQLGFATLFLFAVVLLMASSVPLFFMAHHHHGDGVGWGEFLDFIREKDHRGDISSFVGRGIDDMIMTWIWPIYMFLVIADFEKMGGIVSATSVLIVVATFVAGKVFDSLRLRGGLGDEKVFWLSGWLMAGLRLMRSFVVSAGGVLAVEGVEKVTSPFYWVPFDGYLYSAAKRSSPVAYFVFREIIYSLGRLLAVGLVIAMLSWPLSWGWIFGLSAVGVVMSLKMSKESNR